MRKYVITSKQNPKWEAQRETLMRWGWEAFVRLRSIIPTRSNLLLNCWTPHYGHDTNGAKDNIFLVQCQVSARCPFCTAKPKPCRMMCTCHHASALQRCHNFYHATKPAKAFIYSFYPALSNRWTDCRSLTLSHDQHICHLKPRLVSHWITLATSASCITVLRMW